MNLDLRMLVLKNALEIEKSLSNILLAHLDIKKNTSRTLGTKGSSLSTKSKSDLLLDIEAINKETYTRLIVFMEIRNQFMHNHDASSFSIVRERINKKTYLNKQFETLLSTYPSFASMDNEEQILWGFKKMVYDILAELTNVFIKIQKEKIQRAREREAIQQIETHRKMIQLIEESIDEASIEFENITKKHLDLKSNISQAIRSMIMSKFNTKVENLTIENNGK